MDLSSFGKYELSGYSVDHLKNLLKEVNKEEDPALYDKIKTIIVGKQFEQMSKDNP